LRPPPVERTTNPKAERSSQPRKAFAPQQFVATRRGSAPNISVYPNANRVGIFNTDQRAQRRFGRNTYLYVAFRLFRDKQRPARPRRQRGFVGELQLARERRLPNGAGHVPAGEPEPAELVVRHEFLDQRKELSLLKPDVCVKQSPRRVQRLSIDAAGRDGNIEFASEPLELHVLDACLAEESRLRLDVPEEKREELFFLIPKVETLFVPEELHELPGRREPSRSISVRGSTAQPHGLHESIVMVARERDQGGVTLHSTTLGYGVVPAVLAGLTRHRHHPVPQHGTHVVNLVLGRVTGVLFGGIATNRVRVGLRFDVSRRGG
jgi:hypothetical protein